MTQAENTKQARASQDAGDQQHICLSIEGDILPWLSDHDRARNPVLLDFDADIDEAGTFRIDLDVVFNPLLVRCGLVERVDYRIGSTGLKVSVKAIHGTVTNFTPARKIPTHYSNAETFYRNAGLTLTPAFKAKASGSEVDAQIGEITREASREVVYTVTFAGEERDLATTHLGNAVSWDFDLPHGPKAIRDYLLGNLYIFAECVWMKSPRAGVIVVRPSDVRFFDERRRPMGFRRSLFMQAVLWIKGIRIQNIDGFSVYFCEV